MLGPYDSVEVFRSTFLASGFPFSFSGGQFGPKGVHFGLEGRFLVFENHFRALGVSGSRFNFIV